MIDSNLKGEDNYGNDDDDDDDEQDPNEDGNQQDFDHSSMDADE